MVFPNDCTNWRELTRALFAEFIAMTLFVYFGTGSVIGSGEFLTQDGVTRSNTVGRILPIAMSFGFSIVILAYAIGHISGAHINPAVTFFLLLMQQVSPLRAGLYMVMQFTGAVLGSLIIWGSTSQLSNHNPIVGDPPFSLGATTLNSELSHGNGFLLEFMGTFLLCSIVYTTAVKGGGPSDGQPNLAPLVIGFAVFVAHLTLIPFTGCGINPARTFGPAVVNSMANSNVWMSWTWIYYVGPFAGAFASACMCFFLREEYDEVDSVVSEEKDAADAAEAAEKKSGHKKHHKSEVRKYHFPKYLESTGFQSVAQEEEEDYDEEEKDDTIELRRVSSHSKIPIPPAIKVSKQQMRSVSDPEIIPNISLEMESREAP